MRIRDLAAFLSVCRNGSIRKGSQEQFISPQGLSKQMQALEKRVGAPLFRREANGICLTEYGEIFKKYAESVIERTRRMETAIQKQWYKMNHFVEFACSRGLPGTLLYEYFEDIRLRNPGIEIKITEAEDRDVHSRVLAEDWVIGVAAMPDDRRDYSIDALYSYRYVLLAGNEHPLAARSVVTASDLHGEALILTRENSAACSAVLDECRKRGFTPRTVLHTDETTMRIRLCAMNKGVAVIPEFLLEGLAPVGVSAVPFDDGFPGWDAVLLTRKNGVPPESAALLKEYLKRAMRKNV